MSTEAITLEVDSEAARAFKAASTEERKKFVIFVSYWLKKYPRNHTKYGPRKNTKRTKTCFVECHSTIHRLKSVPLRRVQSRVEPMRSVESSVLLQARGPVEHDRHW